MFLFFVFPEAFAGCGGGLYGDSKSGGFYIGDGDCEYQGTMIVFTDQMGGKKLYSFNRECEFTIDRNGVGIGFYCKLNGKSPLAGARYRLRTKPKEKGACDIPPLQYYECTKECSEKIPKRFDIEPVECDG
jgi:hypothetical protein